MKNLKILIACAIVVSLCACQNVIPNGQESTTIATTEEQKITESVDSSNTIETTETTEAAETTETTETTEFKDGSEFSESDSVTESTEKAEVTSSEEETMVTEVVDVETESIEITEPVIIPPIVEPDTDVCSEEDESTEEMTEFKTEEVTEDITEETTARNDETGDTVPLWEEWLALPNQDAQMEFMSQFEDLEAFFNWKNAAEEDYNRRHPATEIESDGNISIGDNN